MTTVVMPNTAPNGIKLIVSTFGGAAATFLLFVLMFELINKPVPDIIEKKAHPVIAITLEDRDETTRVLPPKLIEPPKMQKSPPPMQLEVEPMEPTGIDDNGFGRYTLNNDVNTKISPPVLSTSNGDATPIVRIEPHYPVAAAAAGTEGWVKLSFSINKLGKVDNIKVLSSEPRRVFDRAAKQALKKWKYRPKMEQGVAISQPNMNVLLSFNLQE